MYAHAPACCADNPHNWSRPVSLGSPVNITSALVADEHGRLHAAFASLDTKNIVYLRSDDGGTTWPVWVEIPSGARLGDEYTMYPRLAVDGRGRVHAVWTVMPYGGRAVMYARSDDGGDSWSNPEPIDIASNPDYEEGYGPIYIDIEAHGEDEIHLIWDGAPTVERNHIWSSDGGNTWSAPTLVFPISGTGRSGWNDMVVDGAGTLHAVALKAPWYANWSRGRWSDSMAIGHADHTTSYEWLRVALSLGNQLNVVWTDKKKDLDPVWYVAGNVIEAPAIAAQPLPTVAPTPLSTPTSVARPTAVASLVAAPVTPTVRARPSFDNAVLTDNKVFSNPAGPVLFGLGLALLIVGIVFVVSIWQLRQ
jgi:hypothetical protein